MSLRWNFNEKVGEAVIVQTFQGKTNSMIKNLYQGNAYLIFLNEWEEEGKNLYSLYSFWADKQHMKNCLGLTSKKNEESFNYFNTPECTLTTVRLNKRKCKYLKDIINALVSGFDNIKIEIYSEG